MRERGKEKHFSYGFIDAEGKVRQARALGTRGLGATFGREATVAMLQHNLAAKGKASQGSVVAPEPVRAPQCPTGPLVVVPDPAAAQKSLTIPSVASEPDGSWMDDVVTNLDAVLDGDEERPEPGSAPDPPDFALEYAVAPERLREPAVARARAMKGARVVMTPEQKRALALIEDGGKPGGEDERSL